jgi:hypothetical protein
MILFLFARHYLFQGSGDAIKIIEPQCKMFGVVIFAFSFNAGTSPYPISSAKINTILGFEGTDA